MTIPEMYSLLGVPFENGDLILMVNPMLFFHEGKFGILPDCNIPKAAIKICPLTPFDCKFGPTIKQWDKIIEKSTARLLKGDFDNATENPK